MNTFTNPRFNIRKFVAISILSLLIVGVVGQTAYANESAIAPSANDDIAYNLKMVNTPGYGHIGNHWDHYVASLNWLDYQQPLAINDAPSAVTPECGLAC